MSFKVGDRVVVVRVAGVYSDEEQYVGMSGTYIGPDMHNLGDAIKLDGVHYVPNSVRARMIDGRTDLWFATEGQVKLRTRVLTKRKGYRVDPGPRTL